MAMKTAIDKRRVMRNAWYLKRVVMKVHCFGECLRRAWCSEKLRRMQRLAEGRPARECTPLCLPAACRPQNSPAFIDGCVAYYAEARPGRYFGD